MRFPTVAFCLAAVLAPFHGARAQTTFASITGTVTDAGGAVIPGVLVEATHVRSNYRFTAQSNDAGAYTLSQLREASTSCTRLRPVSRSSSSRTFC